MNDFTKEELESIIQGFEYIEGSPAWRDTIGWDDDLKNKIQSMIDNYCDPCVHEFTRRKIQLDLCHKCNNFKFVFANPKDLGND